MTGSPGTAHFNGNGRNPLVFPVKDDRPAFRIGRNIIIPLSSANYRSRGQGDRFSNGNKLKIGIYTDCLSLARVTSQIIGVRPVPGLGDADRVPGCP